MSGKFFPHTCELSKKFCTFVAKSKWCLKLKDMTDLINDYAEDKE